MSNLIKRFISENTGIIIRIDDIAENMNSINGKMRGIV